MRHVWYQTLFFYAFSFLPLLWFQTIGPSTSSCLFLYKPFFLLLLTAYHLMTKYLLCQISSWNASCHCDITLRSQFLVHGFYQLIRMRFRTIQILCYIFGTHHILIISHMFVLLSLFRISLHYL